MKFNSDGTKVFLLGSTGGGVVTIYSYTCSIAYDISSRGATTGNFVVDDLDGSEARSFDITEDGKRIFVLSDASVLWEVYLPTADSLTSAVLQQRTRDFFVPGWGVSDISSISFAVGNDSRATVVESEADSVMTLYSSAVRVA